VPIRRYRYTKLRWRILVRLFDLIGGLFALAWRFFRPVEIPAETRRILIVQLDHLGDSVLTSPLLPVLKRAYPAARIDVLASPSNRAVFQADEHISNVIVADRNWFDRRPGRFALATAVARIGLSLRGGGYDLGIDVRGDVLTVLVLCLAGIPRRLGWEMGGGGFLLTDRAEWVPGRHEVESRLALAEALGIDAQADGGPRVAVGVIDRDRSRVARLLCEAWPSKSRLRIPATVAAGEIDSLDFARRRSSARGEIEADWLHAGRFGEEAPLLAVHVGAGTAAKRWPAGHWRDLLNRFLEDGWRVLVVGGPDGEPMADGLPDHENLRDWSGLLAVTETAALLERADLFIGADSGPAHLAACAGVPSVVLFSGTNHAAQWRPWSRRTLVLRHQVACRPCHRKVCPFADHPCMAGLTPGVVFDRARRWWAEGSGAEVQDVVS
jgi:heptosyltransferase-2